MTMHGPVALVTVDDGRANTLNGSTVDALLGALGAAEKEAGAVVLAGRPKYFCTGLDMNVLWPGSEAASDLLHKCTDMLLRLVEYPRPLVAACTGHALATGALMLLCCDVRIGPAGDYKIGLNEVSLGVPLPELAIELARARLSPRYMTLACNTAQIYSPAQAVNVGFLDSTTDNVVEHACGVAAGLAQRLDQGAFAATRVTSCRRLTDTIMRTAGDLLGVTLAAKRAAARRND